MIRVAVSACLLGERVRYDGTDRGHPALATLGERFELVAMCPEVEIGLGVPRAPIRLLTSGRVLDSATGRDVTDDLVELARRRAARFRESDVCGVVLKHKSPSCGVSGVKVFASYADADCGGGRGVGVFASVLLSELSGIPAAQECELQTEHDVQSFARSVERFARSQ